MPMEFRKAQPEDVTRLQHIANQNIDTFYRSVIGDTGADRFLQSGASDRYIENNIAHATVMYQTEDRDTIVGFAVCKHDLITLLMMATETHRQGFGSQLLKHCEQALLGKTTGGTQGRTQDRTGPN